MKIFKNLKKIEDRYKKNKIDVENINRNKNFRRSISTKHRIL